MRKLVSKLLFALLTMVSFNVNAQDLDKLVTPYEKARAKLADEAVAQIMKNDMQMTLSIGLMVGKMQEDGWSEWKQLKAMEELIATVWGAYNWGEPQTYNDYRAFQRIGPACEEYAKKREALEKTKTPLDIEREKQRNYVPPIGALSTVMQNTGKELSKLFTKGDYEKLAQYRKRIAETAPHIFDSIAYAQCALHAVASIQNGHQNYDVETELDTIYLSHREGNKVLATCHMSPEFAKKVYSQYRSIDADYLRIFVVNGDVLPYKMTMKTNDDNWQYVFHPINNKSAVDTNVTFSIAKTGITDTIILQTVGNYTFDYNKKLNHKLQKLAEEKAREEARKAREALEETLATKLYNTFGKDGGEICLGCRNLGSSFNIKELNSLSEGVCNSACQDFNNLTGMTLEECCLELKELRGLYRLSYKEYVHQRNLDIESVDSLIDLRYNLLEYDSIYHSLFELLLYGMRSSFQQKRGLAGFTYVFSIEKDKQKLVSFVENLKKKNYLLTYSTFAKWIIENDKKAAKEWKKRQEKYSSIVEFYEEYISDDYRPRK